MRLFCVPASVSSNPARQDRTRAHRDRCHPSCGTRLRGGRAAPAATPAAPLPAADLRPDYLQACDPIASDCVYFERKCSSSRAEFLAQRRAHADSIDWKAASFITELRSLRAMVPDGHFAWRIPEARRPIDGFYRLGFAATCDADSTVRVVRTYPVHPCSLRPGDRIVAIHDRPVAEYLALLGQREPQSTPLAPREVAARNLSLVKSFAPILDRLPEMRLGVRRERARIVGAPWAGRGGGTETFVREHTGASISFPLRERPPSVCRAAPGRHGEGGVRIWTHDPLTAAASASPPACRE
ncbi:MAG: hypothetical protein GF330_04065 [Candidatus Eisenbacteria bacterium]|nr:hypothetical protein [Candidatus Eisenbacteria bacterium]